MRLVEVEVEVVGARQAVAECHTRVLIARIPLHLKPSQCTLIVVKTPAASSITCTWGQEVVLAPVLAPVLELDDEHYVETIHTST